MIVTCPKCGSSSVNKRGIYPSGTQAYSCKICSSRFAPNRLWFGGKRLVGDQPLTPAQRSKRYRTQKALKALGAKP